MSAKPRSAVLTLLAALAAVLLPATGAFAAGTADRDGTHRLPAAVSASHPARLVEKSAHKAHQGRQIRQSHRTGAVPTPRYKRHQAASNPVRRMVQAGQTIKGRHDNGKPALAVGAALLAVGGGAVGARHLVRRRATARTGG